VKHTADEFDQWYEGPASRRTLRIPAVVVSLVTVFAAVLLAAR
jgi:hypothetical protein